MRRRNALRKWLVAVMLAAIVMAAGTAAWAGEDAGAPDGPASAPTAPWISIFKNSSSSIRLGWDHPDQTISLYEVWRSESPYFDPNMGQGTKIDSYSFNASAYGSGIPFAYIDDGVCGYYTAPGSAPGCRFQQNPTVTVIGDVAHNYVWVVRVGNGGGEYDVSNRVGEFDFGLVKGG